MVSKKERLREFEKVIKEGHKHLTTLEPIVDDLIEGLNKAPTRIRPEVVMSVVATVVRFTTKGPIEAWGILEGAKQYIASELGVYKGSLRRLERRPEGVE